MTGCVLLINKWVTHHHTNSCRVKCLINSRNKSLTTLISFQFWDGFFRSFARYFGVILSAALSVHGALALKWKAWMKLMPARCAKREWVTESVCVRWKKRSTIFLAVKSPSEIHINIFMIKSLRDVFAEWKTTKEPNMTWTSYQTSTAWETALY
jgi:hypothetical protein